MQPTFARILLVLAGLMVALVAQAWTGPTGTPPNNNTPPPITATGGPQTMSNSLSIINTSGRGIQATSQNGDWSGCFGSDCTGGAANGYGIYANGTSYAGYFNGKVNASQYCIAGGNCISSWPAGSGGTITGSGSTNYIPVFTGASSIGNSILSQGGGWVNISGGISVISTLQRGIQAYAPAGQWTGCFGSDCTGVPAGQSVSQYGIYALGTTWAGYFNGPVTATQYCVNSGSCRTSLGVSWGAQFWATDANSGGGYSLCPSGSVQVGSYTTPTGILGTNLFGGTNFNFTSLCQWIN